PAVPLMVTPAPVKPLTGPLKTAVKLTGELLVGSAWPAAWLIVTAGRVASKVTVLLVVVEAVWRLAAAPWATPAAMLPGTAAEVVRLPAASRATAVSVCEPLLAVVVFQETEYGAAASSTPRLAPSSRNCTPTTPTSSEALAVTLVVPPTVAPETGEVMLTVGGVVSGGAWVVALAELDCAERLPAATEAATVER